MSEADDRSMANYDLGFEAGLKAGREEGSGVYDSRPDTYAHIQMVQRVMGLAIADLQKRALVHDRSKLVEPERSAYNGLPTKLKGLEYGSEEYRAQLRHPAIKGHQTSNDHHPEFHGEAGIHGMDLIQLLEMICDWIAATRRMDTGNIWKSIEKNVERFGYGDEIKGLLYLTAKRLLDLEAQAYPAYKLMSVEDMMSEGMPTN